MLKLKNIHKSYGNTHVLKGVSLDFDRQGMTFILGKSGSGKSTLLNIIGGLDQYDEGQMWIDDISTQNFDSKDFDSYRNSSIGFIFQEFHLLEDYTVYENIQLALDLQAKTVEENQLNELLQRLELTKLKERKVNELSGGQKQRVAIARALIKNPSIILADEPTGNLDTENSKQVLAILKDISKEHLVIVVSHDQESASLYGDRIIEIQDGLIALDSASPADLSTSHYESKHYALPNKTGFKLGMKLLKHKKRKLAITIGLSVFALVFSTIVFSLSTFKAKDALKKLLDDQGVHSVMVQLGNNYNFPSSLRNQNINEIEQMIQKQGDRVYQIAKNTYGYENVNEVFHINNSDLNLAYNYGSYEMQIVEVNNHLTNEKLIGHLPENAKEVVISNKVANDMIRYGIYDQGNLIHYENYDDILNHQVPFSTNDEVIISGIVEYDLSDYENVVDQIEAGEDELSSGDHALFMIYCAKAMNIYNKVYVHPDFIDTINTGEGTISLLHHLSVVDSNDLRDFYDASIALDTSVEVFNGSEIVTINYLEDHEIIIPANMIEDFDPYVYEMFQSDVEKMNYLTSLQMIGKDMKCMMDEDEYTFKIAGILFNDDVKYYFPTSFKTYQQGRIIPQYIMYELDEIDWNQKYDALLRTPYRFRTTFTYDINQSIEIINIVKRIAAVLAVLFVLFTCMLLANLMSTSIQAKQKDIGILRALGASKKDIGKIFMLEGSMIVIVSFILSSIIFILAGKLINWYIKYASGSIIDSIIFSPIQFIFILVLLVVIVLISTYSPIQKYTKMKVIDVINKK